MLVPPVSDEMPPRMHFKASRSETNNNDNQNSQRSAVEEQPPQRSSAPATADPASQQVQRKTAQSDDNQHGRPIKTSSVVAPQQPPAKNRTLARNNDLLAQSSTETLLDLLKAHAGLKECSEETTSHICGILAELYTRVKGARGEWRGAVLGALYGLVECTAARILVSVARVVLVVSG